MIDGKNIIGIALKTGYVEGVDPNAIDLGNPQDTAYLLASELKKDPKNTSLIARAIKMSPSKNDGAIVWDTTGSKYDELESSGYPSDKTPKSYDESIVGPTTVYSDNPKIFIRTNGVIQ